MSFTLLGSLQVQDGQQTRQISVYHGDLANIPQEHSVDLLVLSAFRDDYVPTSGSLIGALYRQGLSVGALARDKAYDLRQTSSFWLSKPLGSDHGALNIGRIACFEPLPAQFPPQLVSALFQGLFPFLDMATENSVAMPPLAAGDQGWPAETMFGALLDAATQWLARGLPVSELKIVVHRRDQAENLASMLRDYRSEDQKTEPETLATRPSVFLSFSSKDAEAAETIKASLIQANQETEIFDYRLSIEKGASWQSEIDQAISKSRSIISVLTPAYFSSVECREELMMARLRHKRSDRPILFPIYWRDWGKELDLWIQIINYIDCREADQARLADEVQALGAGF